ncbi:TPA: plasmid recombination protein [Enterococcus faecalis]|nr:plasmid recombination protein [Enterococcus faecalis]HAP4915510.1 plasmid recombination protein [Enterococcus faecalis]HAP4921546.1 plasmid recombination protein [Enterococcus faecalis]HBI2014913.1 plasmid recombination protein [Enterococcus faecalis]
MLLQKTCEKNSLKKTKEVVHMSMLIARMQKINRGTLTIIENHNKRKFKSSLPKEIDTTLTCLNYDLVLDSSISYRKAIIGYITQNKASDRALRKDAILVVEWLISSDSAFFISLSTEEIRRFFQTALEFFQKRYGISNVAYAQIHLDEPIPHMHLGVVPLREGRLTAKTVFTREELRNIQAELPDYLTHAGFDISRGQKKKARNPLKLEEEWEQLAQEKEALVLEQQTFQAISSETKQFQEKLDSWVTFSPFSKTAKLSHEHYQELYALLEQAKKAMNISKITKEVNKDLLLENKNLKYKNQELINISKRVASENEQLRERLAKFKKTSPENN